MDPTDFSMLVTLDALLQESSVTRAARRLGLSTPAVSNALARLRDRFDDPLLVRAGRGMVLTPRAQALQPRVREAMAVAARVFQARETFEPARLERTFKLSMTDYVMLVFGAAFERLRWVRAPDLSLRYLPNSVDDATMLRRGDTDLAIGIYGALPPELKTRQVITDRFVCVVRTEHPAVDEELSLELFTTLRHIQVAPRGRPGGYIDDMLAERGCQRRVARAVPYFRVALEMTAHSDYVLTISERIARSIGPALGLKLLEPPLPLEPYALSMVWHPRFDAEPAHQWLREQFLEATQMLDGNAHENPRRRLDDSDPTTGQGRKRPRRG